MERTKHNKSDLILTSDWHLREDTPICRADDFWATQWQKVDFIRELQEKYNCPVICAGDIFDHWKPSPYLLSETIKHIPNDFKAIYGQHDLPQHNMQLQYKSGLNTLKIANKIEILPECHFGQIPKIGIYLVTVEPSNYKTIRNIVNPIKLFPKKPEKLIASNCKKMLIWHVMNYKSEKPYPECSTTALGLLKKYPQFDLIVTGDNHKPFVERYEGRLLINPGSLMRQSADQIDHKPRVYLYYVKTNTVRPIYLPIIEDVISREHIEIKQRRDERIDAFVSRLDKEFKFIEGVDAIEKGLKQFIQMNKIPSSVAKIIFKAIEK